MPDSSYDEIAVMYHALWATSYLPAAEPALEKLFFARLVPPAHVLDVCCGSGHVTSTLVKRGYRVTGVDVSRLCLKSPAAKSHKPTSWCKTFVVWNWKACMMARCPLLTHSITFSLSKICIARLQVSTPRCAGAGYSSST